jgi:hypothetical protein
MESERVLAEGQADTTHQLFDQRHQRKQILFNREMESILVLQVDGD